MNVQDARVGDVVYGRLPHEDGWAVHYGVVLSVDLGHNRVLIVSGTSQGVLDDDAELAVGEVVARGPDLELMGLRKPTRFKLVNHTKFVGGEALLSLERCGRVEDGSYLDQRFVVAFQAAMGQWRRNCARRG